MQNDSSYKNEKDIFTALQWVDRSISIAQLCQNMTNQNLSQQQKMQNFLSAMFNSAIKEFFGHFAHREYEDRIISLIKDGEIAFGTAIEKDEIDNMLMFLADSFTFQFGDKIVKKDEINDYTSVIEQIKEIYANPFNVNLINSSEIFVTAVIHINKDSTETPQKKYKYSSQWALLSNCYKLVKIKCEQAY